MKKIIFTGVFLLSFCSLFAQEQAIIYELKKPLGTIFIQNDKALTPKQLLEITKSNAVAHSEMKRARANFTTSMVLGAIGGGLVGISLGNAFGGRDANWTPALIGAGVIGLSIPFSNAYTKHAQHAARIYNHGLKETGMTHSEIKLGLSSGGLGIKLTF